MIALTQRLHERDETIIGLQALLPALALHSAQLESIIPRLTRNIQRKALQHNIPTQEACFGRFHDGCLGAFL